MFLIGIKIILKVGLFQLIKAEKPIYHIEIENQSVKSNIIDAGVGIVQVFPIVVRAFAKCNEKCLIIIEEPETHLHPAAHGNLAELIFSSIKEDKNKMYLIETHSLNFILRLRRLIAEKIIPNTMVNLYYVDFVENEISSFLKKININEDGSVDYWPEGVFSESLDESIAIRNAQLNK